MRFLLISSLLLILSTNAHADELRIGMVTDFKGIFCKTEVPAQRIAAAMEENYEAGVVRYHIEPTCVLIRLHVRTLRVVPSLSGSTWNIGEVETVTGQHYFIVTTMGIVVGPSI